MLWGVGAGVRRGITLANSAAVVKGGVVLEAKLAGYHVLDLISIIVQNFPLTTYTCLCLFKSDRGSVSRHHRNSSLGESCAQSWAEQTLVT